MARRKHNHPQRDMNSLRRRNANENVETSQNSAAGEIQEEDVEETPENSVAVVENAEIEEKLAISRSDDGEKSRSLVNVGGGQREDRPPEDDCCPFCHDDLHIPCRTNCGHWICASWLMQMWRHTNKHCECPVCGSLIFNLIPNPSALINPGEEVTKILEEVAKYNRQNMVRRLDVLKKAVASHFSLTSLTIIVMISRTLLAVYRVGRFVYEEYSLDFSPYVRTGSIMVFCAFICALLVFVIKNWKSL